MENILFQLVQAIEEVCVKPRNKLIDKPIPFDTIMIMNQKLYIIIGTVVLIILAIGGGYFFYTKSASQQVAAPVAQQEQQVLTLKPEDIGLTLAPIASGKFAGNGVDMTITKFADISSIDYELSYTSKGNIPRGAIGHIDVKPGQNSIDQQLPYGTCSDVCHFDSDVTSVKITLKVTKQDGKIYQLVAPFNQ